MILVAGLTPAWQQILCFDSVHPGEVNRAAEVHWCASGKAINAGLALASLGGSVHLLSPAGGWSGQAMRDELTQHNVPTTWVATAVATRVCTTVVNRAKATSTEFVENAAALTTQELAAFSAEYRTLVSRADFVILTGSLPRGTPVDFYRRLLQSTPCPALLDARGAELLAALDCKPRVVKPNREELAKSVGRPLPDRASVLAAMRELVERGAHSVIVTHGAAGVWVMQGGDTWEFTPPKVTPDNPIGSGDCLAAGVALALTRGDKLADAVRLGIAAATDNVAQLLPARLALDRVEEFKSRIPPPTLILPSSRHLLLPRQLVESMVQHARAELPNECCGLLAGRRDGDVLRVEAWYPLVNEAASPIEYRSEPRSMFQAIKRMRQENQEILAIYHSHPTSAPVPSRTDLARFYSSDVVHLILGFAGAEPLMRGWWLTESSYEEATWHVVDE